MITQAEAEARVARGAAHLDRVRPGWHDQIDVGTLTLHDPCGCIVGQLCGTGRTEFCEGLRRLGFTERGIPAGLNMKEPGFDAFIASGGTAREWYRPLQDAWIQEIARRRLPMVENPSADPRETTAAPDEPRDDERGKEAVMNPSIRLRV